MIYRKALIVGAAISLLCGAELAGAQPLSMESERLRMQQEIQDLYTIVFKEPEKDEQRLIAPANKANTGVLLACIHPGKALGNWSER